MVAGDVQRVEVVPVGFDLRAFGDRKAHVGEDRRDLLGHLGDRVDRALPARPARERHVEPFGPEPLVKRGIGQSRLLCRDGRPDLVLQRVERGAGDLPLFGGHRAQFAHLQADLALLAQRGKPHLLERGFVRGGGNGGKIALPQIVHADPLGIVVVLLARGPRKRKKPRARGSAASRIQPVRGGYASAALALSTMPLKASGSWMARSASTLRSTSIPATARPLMKREYVSAGS
jgi:hypothetical protein